MQYLEFQLETQNGEKLFAFECWPDEKKLSNGKEEAIKGVICLIHGIGEHSGRYHHVAEYLTRAGYAVMAIDLRGHGKSPGRRGYIESYDTFMDDVSALINQAMKSYPKLPCFLYGHSMGGNLVLNFALRRKPQLAGVISSSPWLKLTFDPAPLKVKLGLTMNKLWPAFSQANKLEVGHLSHDPKVLEAYQNDPLIHSWISARLFAGCYQAGLWAIKHANQLTLPLLLMHGSGDRITAAAGSKQFARQIPAKCTLKIWDGLYHELHNEVNHQEIIDLIIKWMESSNE